jgi:hypothetical protein
MARHGGRWTVDPGKEDDVAAIGDREDEEAGDRVRRADIDPPNARGYERGFVFCGS